MNWQKNLTALRRDLLKATCGSAQIFQLFKRWLEASALGKQAEPCCQILK
ncbi:MAG: hypothetical protein ACM37W_01915 [Actinomycetota bacterium]